MRKLAMLSAIAIVVIPAIAFGLRSETEPSVTIESWKKGTEQICPQTVPIVLDAKNPTFETTIKSKSSRTYTLKVEHNPLPWKPRENWAVSLFENNGELAREDLRENLLMLERPGPGGDYFPRENKIGILYPKAVSNVRSNGVYLIDGVAFYPIWTIRKIRVEGFEVIIQVINYSEAESNPNKIESLEVSVEFKNADGS